jgi:hypothetical protein
VGRRTVLALAGVLIAAGCGSSSHSTDAKNATLEKLAQGPGLSTVGLTLGVGDFGTGPSRFTFLVVDKKGKLVTKPSADVWIAHSYKQPPFQHTTARLERVGVPGVSDADISNAPTIYVAHVQTRKPGTYWIVAQPKDTKTTGVGSIVVRPRSYSVQVGKRAPASNTPTLATTHGKLRPLTTSTHPDRALYKTSVAQALKAHDPFVVVFATPKFCTSRACGPVVDVVSRVRKTMGDKRIRFMHVEVYKDNNPAKGYNRWMREWGLQSEPWVYLVRGNGRIAEKFEGPVSVRELRAAIESKLAV